MAILGMDDFNNIWMREFGVSAFIEKRRARLALLEWEDFGGIVLPSFLGEDCVYGESREGDGVYEAEVCVICSFGYFWKRLEG